MATSVEIGTKALKKLGVLAVGQTASAEITADMADAYSEVYAQLDARNLVEDWDMDEEVPDEYVNPMVALVAYARVDEYSVPNDRYQRITLDMRQAIGQIREMQESNVYAVPKAVYY